MDRLHGNGEIISQVSQDSVPHSSFDLRNHNFFSGKLGKLIVSRFDEVYPGDKIVGAPESVVQFEPLAAPIMGNMAIKQEAFFIPAKILWKNFYKMVTGKHDYSGKVPLISPYQILQYYVQLGLFKDPVSLGEDILTDEMTGTQAINAINQYFYDWRSSLISFGDQYGVRDLLQYVENRLDEMFFDYDKPQELWTPTWIAMHAAQNAQRADNNNAAYKNYIVNYFLPFIKDILLHYFGPSSHFDYMNWPVPEDIDIWIYDGYLDSENNPVPTLAGAMLGADKDLPTYNEIFSSVGLSFLPFRASYLVWYWNYRDELLETAAPDPEEDETFIGDSVTPLWAVLCTLMRVRCWNKDIFTTSLTNTGDGNLFVPTTNDINSDSSYTFYDSTNNIIHTQDFESAFAAGATIVSITSPGNMTYRVPMNYFTSSFDSNDLNSHTASFISLDLFDRIQRLRRFVQRKLILGYEYDDVVWSSFAVKVSSSVLRIPVLLAQGRDTIAINTIVNNTTIPNGQVAGDKAAIAYGNGRMNNVNYFAEEHGYYMQYFTILPLPSYCGGMPRLYMKHEQFDFMWPEFATLGMDAVYNFELSAPRGNGPYLKNGLSDAAAMQVFGYQGRYYDLKSKLDEAHGRFRTDWNFMLFSRQFNGENLPKLNYQFVHCFPPLDMFVVNDDSEDLFKVDCYNGVDFQRRLPVPSEFV